MTNDNTSISGIVFIGDFEGNIISILKDSFQIFDNLNNNINFYIDNGSIEKYNYFLNELKIRKTAINWAINFVYNSEVFQVYFSGAVFKEETLYFCLLNQSDLEAMIEVLRSNFGDNLDAFLSVLDSNLQEEKVSFIVDSNVEENLFLLNNELVNAKRELIKKNVELDRLNKLKNHFLGIAAHDLKNPLNLILNYSILLLEETESKLSEDHIKMLNTVKSASLFMNNLINQFLDYSKIESGSFEIDYQLNDITQVVKETLIFSRLNSSKSRINIIYKSEPIEIFYFDKARIMQVVSNLVDNAIKYSPFNSRIFVNICKVEESVIISIKDEGQGIPESEKENIFKPFYQINQKTKNRGVGLGLSIAHKIIAAHYGKIWFETEVDKGTTFFVKIPIETY